MPDTQLAIRFTDTSSAQANQWAGDLKTVLETCHRQVEASQVREDTETMDLGTSLGVILGSGAVVAVAKGIQAWLARNQGATLELTNQQGQTVKATGLRSGDAADLVRGFLKQSSGS